MTRTTTGLCAAAALGFAVSLAAQTTTTPNQTTTSRDRNNSQEITVTGCLARGSDGNFMLNNAHVENGMANRSSSTSNPSTTTAGGATTTGTTGTSATNPTSTAEYGKNSSTMNESTWMLMGGKDLDKHVGHKVEVTGRADMSSKSSSGSTTSSNPSTTTGAATGTTATGGHETTGQRDRNMSTGHLNVTSVKMISTNCQ